MALDRNAAFSTISLHGLKYYYQDGKIFSMSTDEELQIGTLPTPEEGKELELHNVYHQQFRQAWDRIGTIDASAAGSDIALGVAERNFITNKDLANAVWVKVHPSIAALEVRFLLTTNDADVDIDIWAGRLHRTGNNVEMARVCTLDIICGQQNANDSTHHYADTINITNNKWLKTAYSVILGDDHQARFIVDLCGNGLVLFHGYGTFDEDCIVEISGFA